MHRRIVALVSGALFLLVAVADVVVVDLHDRTYPQKLHTKSVVNLDFASSSLSDDEAFEQLGRLSDKLGLALVKIAPDLRGEGAAQVFVEVGTETNLPQRVGRFGDAAAAEVRGREALEHSYASGDYLVTGSMSKVGGFKVWLDEEAVRAKWNDDSLGTTVNLLIKQPSFLVTMVSIVALLIALVLYWLSVKARGRALRTLAGVPARRIHYEDVGAFLLAVAPTLLVVAGLASVYVGLSHDWGFVPLYLSTLLLFGGSAIGVAMVGAVAMSMLSWPSPDSLSRRESPVKSLRKVSMVLKAVAFVLVLTAIAPAVTAWSEARSASTQLSKWNALADQVTLWFPAALGESGFQGIMAKVGEVVRDADEADSVALSYAYDKEDLDGVDTETFDAFAIVSPRWLKLMSAGQNDPLAGLTPIADNQIPETARDWIEEDIDLWSREPQAGKRPTLGYYQFSTAGAVPLALGGSGDLIFPDNALVVLVPDVYQTFNDSFLGSAATSKNLVFTGLGPTERLLEQHSLGTQLTVKYAAEEGILLAQFTAYFAWLQSAALIGLAVALAVSALISAFIVAILNARRDFPLRLAGRRWADIVGQRVVTEWLVGLALTVVALTLRGWQSPLLTCATAIAALALSPLAHLLASRWVFARVTARQI